MCNNESNQIVIRQGSLLQPIDYANPDQFATVQRACKMLSSSNMVPVPFRPGRTSDGLEITPEQAIANCFLAVEFARSMSVTTMDVMQHANFIHGKLSWSATFLIGRINNCGKYTTLTYKKRDNGPIGKMTVGGKTVDFGDLHDWEFRAVTVEIATGQELEGPAVSMKMAILEGWYSKPGSKWRTMPEVMLGYRAAAFWARLYNPNITSGSVYTTDEMEDIEPVKAQRQKASTAPIATATQPEKIEITAEEVKPEPQPSKPETPGHAKGEPHTNETPQKPARPSKAATSELDDELPLD